MHVEYVIGAVFITAILTIGGCVHSVQKTEADAKRAMVDRGHTPLAARCAFAYSTDMICAGHAAQPH